MLSYRALLATCLVGVALASNAARAQAPKPKDGPLGMKFVALPKATTYLGWKGSNGSLMKTKISEDFEIAIHTVTQGQWTELWTESKMPNNPSWFSRTGVRSGAVQDVSDEDLKFFPVEKVGWRFAKKFIEILNQKEKGKGWLYRLPSTAEWEYACRGGATSEEECSFHFYFAKPTNDLSSTQANFNGAAPFGKANKGPNLKRPTKVGSYPPNKLGLYDMHGNVFQWCEDPQFAQNQPYCGSCYKSTGSDCRAAVTKFAYIGGGGHDGLDIGLRLVRVRSR